MTQVIGVTYKYVSYSGYHTAFFYGTLNAEPSQ